MSIDTDTDTNNQKTTEPIDDDTHPIKQEYQTDIGHAQTTKIETTTGWKHRAGEIMESHRFHIFILILVLTDLVIVLTEIIVIFLEHDKKVAEDDSHATSSSEPTWLRALAWCSIAILCIFCVEIIMHLIVFGWKYYWKHKFHLFDAIVVVASLVLQVTLTGRAEEVVGLVIILRLWRLVRILEGVANAVENRKEEQINKLKFEIKRLRAQLAKYEKPTSSSPPSSQLPQHHIIGIGSTVTTAANTPTPVRDHDSYVHDMTSTFPSQDPSKDSPDEVRLHFDEADIDDDVGHSQTGSRARVLV